MIGSHRTGTKESKRLTTAGLIAVTTATLLMMAWAIFPTAALADQQISVNRGSLSSHTCDDSEWHFVITQIDDLDDPKNGNEDEAPASIHVTWANGNSADLPLDDVTGGTAHYFFFGNLDSTVTSATATIYTGWSGTFNLSHGPCPPPEKGRIEVQKQTVPDGDSQVFSFSGPGSFDPSLSDGQVDGVDVDPGTYTVSETVPAGWTLTDIACNDDNSTDAGNTATFKVEAGETVRCVFTNTKDQPPPPEKGRIEVQKQTVPDGDSQVFSFSGPGSFDPSLSDGQVDGVDVDPGTYTVSETVPAGWTLTDIACNDDNSTDAGNTATFKVEAGETVRCVFTNTKDQPPPPEKGRIEVQKQTVPDGDSQVFSFSGPGSFDPSLSDGQVDGVDVDPGTYTVSETVPAGWTLTDIACNDDNSTDAGNTATFKVEAGETVRCVFTNTKDQPPPPEKGRIEVQKQTVPDGDSQVFSFSGPGSFHPSLSDGQVDGVDVDPGTYTVSETVPAGWTLTDIACNDDNSTDAGNTATFKVEAGETVRCVFTNTKDTTTTTAGGGGGGGTTTTPAPAPTTTTTTTPTVAPTTIHKSTTTTDEVLPTTVTPGGTAFTGVENVVPIGAIALMLMTSGSGLLWAGSRRRRHDDSEDED